MKNKKDRKQQVIHIDDETHRQLKELAKRDKESMTKCMERLIREGVKPKFYY